MAEVEVGGDVDSWCAKCKQMILHTIVAIVDDKPKKVQCNSCKANHVYRAQQPGTKKAKKTAAGAKTALKASDYERLMEGRDRTSSRRYSTKSQFQKSELITHPKFGLGIATALKDTTKVEILFPDGPRVLVHARA